MNSSGYQAPKHSAMITLPVWRVLRTRLRGRQRLSQSRVGFVAARFAAVDSGHRSWHARVERLIKHRRGVCTEVLRIFVVRHFVPLICPVWRGEQAHLTCALLRSFLGLTGLPGRIKLVVSSYQQSRQSGFGCSMKASLLIERGFRAFNAQFEIQDNIFTIQFPVDCSPVSLLYLFRLLCCGLAVSGQFLKREHWGRNHMTQSIKEQIGILPAIKPKLHLFEIRREMLGTQAVPRSCDAAFEKRECRFDCVGMNVPHYVYARTVLDRLVSTASRFFDRYRIRGSVIRKNHVHILADVFADVLSECSGLCVMRMEEAKVTVALSDSDNHFFIVHASDSTFAAIYAANVGSVHFYFSVEHGLVGLRHCMADAVTEIPRCFISADSQSALNLAGGHALLRLTEKKGCGKPRRERQVRVIENRSSGHRELIITVLAVEEMLLGFEFDHRAFAAQTTRAFGEAQARQKFAAFGISREKRVYVH